MAISEMVLRSDGVPVRLAWQLWEEELLAGALFEHATGDLDAIKDCASFLCRGLDSVQAHIRYMAARNRAKVLREARPTSAVAQMKAVVTEMVPRIRQLTTEELMTGRVRVRTHNGWST